MPTVEVPLPKELAAQLDYPVEDGEFVSRDEAVADLISMALTTYEEDSAPDPVGEDLFLQTIADQQDPAARQEPRGGWG